MSKFVIEIKCGPWLASVVLLLSSVSHGHSPHHLITDVASAPNGESEAHTFILITDQVFRSDARGASWKHLVTGLNSQYSFTSVEMSPEYAADQTLFLASSGDGVYRSSDAGESWQKVIGGLDSLDIARLSISRNFGSDGRLLAAAHSGGVWRSTDGGDSWQMILTESVEITSFSEVAGLQENTVVIAGDSDGNVWRSDDNGRLWEIVHNFSAAGAITSASGLVNHVYVGTEKGGLYQSSDGGQSFVQVLLPAESGRPICKKDDPDHSQPDAYITSVTVSPDAAGANTVFATSWYGGVYVSRDDARSWSVWRDGLTCEGQADNLSVPHFRQLEVIKLEDGRFIYWLGAFDGLFRNFDEASPWQQQETLPLGLIKGMALTGGKNQPLAIALSTYGGGFYLTHDRGATWTIGNKGLLTTRLTGMAFSPNYSEDDVIYAGAIRRLLKSSDRGNTWQLIALDTPSFGSRVRNKLAHWGLPVGSSGRNSRPIYPTHIVPLSDEGAVRVLMGTRNHGVMTFVEQSDEIESTWAGTDQVINSLVVSPHFEKDRTLFSSIRGSGVFRSDDGGTTWSAVNQGLDFISDWAQNPDRGDFRRDVSLSISPDFPADDMLFAGSPAGDGLYVSHDRGNSWARSMAVFGASPAPVLAVSVSPEFATDKTLIVSINGRGLFHSDDRGRHFKSIGPQLVDENASIEYLQFSPDYLHDQSVVAASDEKLFLSIDRGDTWTEVRRPVRYEDMRDVVAFEGNWRQRRGQQYSALTETTTLEQGSSASLRFVGRGIRLVGSQGPDYGSAQVLIDGEFRENISLKSDKLRNMQKLYELQGLDPGLHTVEIRTYTEDTEQRPGIFAIDAFDVLP